MESLEANGQYPNDQLLLARQLLKPNPKRDAAWPALAAALFFAVTSMTFAVSAIMTPARDHTLPSVKAVAKP